MRILAWDIFAIMTNNRDLIRDGLATMMNWEISKECIGKDDELGN
jgi:hypothetical protein